MKLTKCLSLLAGVDYDTLMRCPRTDRLWASHLGLSLILSFLVVGAITYHAASYVIENQAVRLAVSTVVALTIFMFDRALYQADWFLQATTPGESGGNIGKVARICLRLGISICLSFALAMFLELAIFSDTITEKLHNDFREANAQLFDKAADYERTLDGQIEERKAALRQAKGGFDEVSRGSLQLAELQGDLRKVTEDRARFVEDRNAELFGQKTKSGQTGIAGRGPAYRFAEAQIGILEGREKELRASIVLLTSELEEARSAAEEQLRKLEEEVAALVTSRAAAASFFRKMAVEGSPQFQKLKNDPLARMQAYTELKQDSEKGTAMILFSWLVRLFICFLEVVPVAAKMFLGPPSVYGAMVTAEVSRRRRLLVEKAAADMREPDYPSEPSPAPFRRLSESRIPRRTPA